MRVKITHSFLQCYIIFIIPIPISVDTTDVTSSKVHSRVISMYTNLYLQ